MTYAAVLRALVEINGIDDANRKLMVFHGELEKAAVAAGAADQKFTGMDASGSRMGATLAKVRSVFTGVGADMDEMGRKSSVFGIIGGGLRKANELAGKLGGGFSGLQVMLGLLIPLAIAFGGSIVAVVGALGPLIGLVAAGGVVMTAFAQAGGVVALATSGVGAALKAASGDAAAYQKALDALPVPAQAFVRQLVSMKPKLDALRKVAAAGLFPGVTEGLKSAAQNFGPVRAVVAATATVLGDLARRAGLLVGSSAFGKDLQTIGTTNAKILGILGTAALHVVSALRHVLVAAGPLTLWLANTANGWALNAASAAKAGRENGKLAAFFDRTRSVLERVGSIIGHVTSGLFGLGRAGTTSGNSILLSIDRAAARFDRWANSVRGQTALQDFFQRCQQLAAALVPVIAGLAQAFGALSLKLFPLTAALRVLGPYANEAVVAFVAFKVAATAIAIAAKVWAAGAAIAAFATGGWTTAFWALNAAMAANPIGIVIVGLAALAAALIYAYTHVKWFRDAVDAVFSFIRDHWPLLLAILTGPIGLAVLAIAKHWDDIKAAAAAAWDFIRSTAETVWNAIGTAVTAPITLAASILATAWEAIKSVATTTWNAIKSVATTTWNAIREAILTPIRAARDLLEGVVTGIANRLSAAWNTIRSAASTAWNAVKDAILGGIRAARDQIESVANGIANRLESAWAAVRSTAVSAWARVRDAIIDAVRAARDKVAGLVGQFVDIGGDIVRGIASGITGAAGSVLSAIGGVVSGAVNKAKGLLGINSPSRVFMEIGGNLSEGLAVGIVADYERVARAIAGLTAMQPSLNGVWTMVANAANAAESAAQSVVPSVTASAGAGAGGSFDVYIEVAPGDDLAAMVGEMIRVKIKQNGRDAKAILNAGLRR